jgi:hypothetical protein
MMLILVSSGFTYLHAATLNINCTTPSSTSTKSRREYLCMLIYNRSTRQIMTMKIAAEQDKVEIGYPLVKVSDYPCWGLAYLRFFSARFRSHHSAASVSGFADCLFGCLIHYTRLGILEHFFRGMVVLLLACLISNFRPRAGQAWKLETSSSYVVHWKGSSDSKRYL